MDMVVSLQAATIGQKKSLIDKKVEESATTGENGPALPDGVWDQMAAARESGTSVTLHFADDGLPPAAPSALPLNPPPVDGPEYNGGFEHQR